jgi:antitoxin HicB
MSTIVNDKTKMSVEDYLKLPYTIEVTKDESEDYTGWFAKVEELPGCMTQADTFDELGEMIEDAKRAWIESALEDGAEIPLPRKAEDYSGKFVVRLPKSLHKQLVDTANQEGVSLNTYVNVALSQAVGRQIAKTSNAAQSMRG